MLKRSDVLQTCIITCWSLWGIVVTNSKPKWYYIEKYRVITSRSTVKICRDEIRSSSDRLTLISDDKTYYVILLPQMSSLISDLTIYSHFLKNYTVMSEKLLDLPCQLLLDQMIKIVVHTPTLHTPCRSGWFTHASLSVYGSGRRQRERGDTLHAKQSQSAICSYRNATHLS